VISEVDAGRAAILRGSWDEARRHPLFQAINEHPFCPYTRTEVRPLADPAGAARRLEAILAEAQAA
jgi:hypothetical protein